MLYYLFLTITDVYGTYSAIVAQNLPLSDCLEIGKRVLSDMKDAYPNDIIDLVCKKQPAQA